MYVLPVGWKQQVGQILPNKEKRLGQTVEKNYGKLGNYDICLGKLYSHTFIGYIYTFFAGPILNIINLSV